MSSKPHLILSSLDVDRLEALLSHPSTQAFPGRAALEAEIGRADIVEPQDIPDNVVTMNSTVSFDIAETGKAFQLTLVYPKDVDGGSDKVSVLAPVGSALLGLSVGDELAWPTVGGQAMTVKVTGISYQPERAGDWHR
ncbi:MAG: nucleoside diphosphate kinase regulator [Comamonas sp.]